jgi:uncharacterized protein YgiM (DUF1202 family)
MSDYDEFMARLGEMQDRGAKADRPEDSGRGPWFWVLGVALVFVITVVLVIASNNGDSTYRKSELSASPPTTSTTPDVRYVTASILNVRSGPSRGAQIVAKLDFGAKVYCDSHSGDWSKVRSKRDGIEGWTSSEFLSWHDAMTTILERYKVGDKIIIPCGQLSRLPKYPGGHEFYVRMENGAYEAERPNDIEELWLDWHFYRNRILEQHARGEYEKAAKARAAFQEINRWLDEYSESDINATYTYLVSIGKIRE